MFIIWSKFKALIRLPMLYALELAKRTSSLLSIHLNRYGNCFLGCLLIVLEPNPCRKFFCPIVGCGACLNSVDDFEDHYNSRHAASCSTCSRVFPTSRLLSIHVSEAHDSFFQAKVARGYAMVSSQILIMFVSKF